MKRKLLTKLVLMALSIGAAAVALSALLRLSLPGAPREIPGSYIGNYDDVSEAVDLRADGTYRQVVWIDRTRLVSVGAWTPTRTVSDGPAVSLNNAWIRDTQAPFDFMRSDVDFNLGTDILGNGTLMVSEFPEVFLTKRQ